MTDDAPVTFIPMKAVGTNGTGIVTPEVRTYQAVKRGYTYMKDGDVIFAKITPCMQNGKHAIVSGTLNGTAFGSTEFHVLRPSDTLDALLVHQFLLRSEFLREAERNFTGTAGQQRVSKEFVAASMFPLPPSDEQGSIVMRLRAMKTIRSAALDQLVAARALADSLIQRLFHAAPE